MFVRVENHSVTELQTARSPEQPFRALSKQTLEQRPAFSVVSGSGRTRPGIPTVVSCQLQIYILIVLTRFILTVRLNATSFMSMILSWNAANPAPFVALRRCQAVFILLARGTSSLCTSTISFPLIATSHGGKRPGGHKCTSSLSESERGTT